MRSHGAQKSYALADKQKAEEQAGGRIEERIEEQVESLRLAHPTLDAWLARLLALRGVKAAQVEDVLEPRMRELMPDPSRLADMDKAVERLVKALQTKQKVGIITDYDVDGACSAAMFIAYWRGLGGLCGYTIPNRSKEGYGANSAAFARLFDDGIEGLVLTTDCGTNDSEVFARAKKEWAERSKVRAEAERAKTETAAGDAAVVVAERAKTQDAAAADALDVIVLDHHEIARSKVEAGSVFAMINPQRADNKVEATSLCACGVVFMLLVALRRRLLADGIVDSSPELKSSESKSPELKSWLNLVALATICDVVELSPLNRAFVRLGLQLLASNRHVGLAELAKVGEEGMRSKRAANKAGSANGGRVFTTRDLGFFFGPRLNACGRLGEAELAVELLLCVDSDGVNGANRVQRLARKIEELNAKRRKLQAVCCEQVLALASAQRAEVAENVAENVAEKNTYFFSNPAWSVGVLGPSASRVAEQLGCPIFLANENFVSLASPQDLLRGSARLPRWGWDACNLARVVEQAKDAGLLLSAGGHARACGFTLQRETVEQFRNFLSEAFDKILAGRTGAEARESLRGFVDMELLPSIATISVAESLSRLAPFGRGNEEPLFAFRDVFIDDCRFVGKDQRHLVCSVSAEGGASRARAIAYNARSSGLGELLLNASDERRPRWLIGFVRADNYIGAGQIVIEDFACSIEGMN